MKFISKDTVLEFEISGTKFKTKPMSMASQADYLSIIADTSGIKSEDSIEIQGKTYARRISENQAMLNTICLRHFISVEGYRTVTEALHDIADIMEYIQMIGTFYKLSTMTEDESKN